MFRSRGLLSRPNLTSSRIPTIPVPASNGLVKNSNSENAALEINGDYSYTGDDGKNYRITYIADENGYQPQGDHLPTPPPVPEQIARALAYLAAHPQPEDKFQQQPSPARFPAPAPPARFPAPAPPARFPAPSPPRFPAPSPSRFPAQPAFGGPSRKFPSPSPFRF
ncbi:vegetative cell wall protein gp1-like isoform X2 [Leguminivora glycinivorella]|uniref:vegetative cell wall protein gp1-like isoform X2 n=1 Tax=Leguminivora glycinivorella TaxID=1035111 RepID=UPI00201073D9|nr:vegetative cell wall protein gp1-like isoform X2 [Leguminivora glycinivorella]